MEREKVYSCSPTINILWLLFVHHLANIIPDADLRLTPSWILLLKGTTQIPPHRLQSRPSLLDRRGLHHPKTSPKQSERQSPFVPRKVLLVRWVAVRQVQRKLPDFGV